jgi:hypothetical protein
MEKNILAEIETFRGTEPEADIGEALRQLFKEVMRRSKQVRLYVFAFSLFGGNLFCAFGFYLVLLFRITDPENQDLGPVVFKMGHFHCWGVVILICQTEISKIMFKRVKKL